MKRLHVHINTDHSQFRQSVAFYTTLFDHAPTKTRENYAKWMLDDPRVNFVIEVIEVEGDRPGVHHVGIQVDDSEELGAIRDSLKEAEAPLLEIGETVCCFSKSEKNWTVDPNGLRWETFRSFGDVDEYGEKTLEELANYVAPAN
jgi:catechol 2,3-dioxygenase-like lactoylglutathione lyase family enzyme